MIFYVVYYYCYLKLICNNSEAVGRLFFWNRYAYDWSFARHRVATRASFSECLGYKSRSGDRLSYIGFSSIVFLDPSIVVPQSHSLSIPCVWFPIIHLTLCNLGWRLRWSRGSVLAFGTQVRGFKPGRGRRIFKGWKILSTPSFGGEVKPSVHCRRFAACKRSLNVAWKSTFRQKLPGNSRPQVPPSAAGISRVVTDVGAPGSKSGNF